MLMKTRAEDWLHGLDVKSWEAELGMSGRAFLPVWEQQFLPFLDYESEPQINL